MNIWNILNPMYTGSPSLCHEYSECLDCKLNLKIATWVCGGACSKQEKKDERVLGIYACGTGFLIMNRNVKGSVNLCTVSSCRDCKLAAQKLVLLIWVSHHNYNASIQDYLMFTKLWKYGDVNREYGHQEIYFGSEIGTVVCLSANFQAYMYICCLYLKAIIG